LLRGNNTTISIAHRLSTIKRSDRVIVIGGDGRVAEEGSYYELSRRKDGAFNTLMQWQLSGDSEPPKKVEPKPSEHEEIEFDLESDKDSDAGDGEEVDRERKTTQKDPGAQ
jgi:putative ABC transport system ATP-binding protein